MGMLLPEIDREISQFRRNRGTARLNIPDFTAFADGPNITSERYSAPVYIQKLKWCVHVCLRVKDGRKYLSVYLCCSSLPPVEENSWNVSVRYELNLHRTTGTPHGLSMGKAVRFNNELHEWGYRDFMEIDRILNSDESFLHPDDSISMSIDIQTLSKVHGCFPVKRLELSIDDFHQFAASDSELNRTSASVLINGFNWTLRVERHSNYLDVYVRCEVDKSNELDGRDNSEMLRMRMTGHAFFLAGTPTSRIHVGANGKFDKAFDVLNQAGKLVAWEYIPLLLATIDGNQVADSVHIAVVFQPKIFDSNS